MLTVNDYFDGIVCINRTCRADRWTHVLDQCQRHGIHEPHRFEAHEGTMRDGSFNGNFGCVASHRGVLELICAMGLESCLVLEDDFEIVEPRKLEYDHCTDRLPFAEQFAK